MGSKLKILSILFILITVFIIYRLLIFNSNDPIFQILCYEGNNKIEKLLGLVPNKNYQIYHRKTVNSVSLPPPYRLIYINNSILADAQENYIFIENLQKYDYQLMASSKPGLNFENPQGITLKNFLAYQINTQIFNKYLTLLHIENEELAIKEYLNILSLVNNKEILRITSANDLNKFEKFHHLKNNLLFSTNIYIILSNNSLWELQFKFDELGMIMEIFALQLK